MSRLGQIRLTTALILTLFNGYLFAQTSREVQGSASADQIAEAASANVDSTQPSQSSRESDRQDLWFVAALNGSGLIPMGKSISRHLSLGVGFGGGWDSNPSNTEKSVSSSFYALSPYLGIHTATSRTQYLLQYQPTITTYSRGEPRTQTMNIASASAVGNLSERWKWDLYGFGSYGPDAARFLAPQQPVAVGGVPATGPNSASYLPGVGTVTYIDAIVGLHYRKSERDMLAVSVENLFSRSSGFNDHSNIVSTDLSYERALSSTLALITYGDVLHYYGSINCESLGAGIGLRWQTRDRTFVSLSGGPQFNTAACGKQQGYSYRAAFRRKLSSKSQIYVISNYQPTASYLGAGLWQRSASGGYQWSTGSGTIDGNGEVAPIGTLDCNLAYVSDNTLTAVSSYQGIFVNCSYSVRVRHGFAISSGYQGYITDSGGTRVNRHVAQFSLAWTNSAGRIFQ